MNSRSMEVLDSWYLNVYILKTSTVVVMLDPQSEFMSVKVSISGYLCNQLLKFWTVSCRKKRVLQYVHRCYTLLLRNASILSLQALRGIAEKKISMFCAIMLPVHVHCPFTACRTHLIMAYIRGQDLIHIYKES